MRKDKIVTDNLGIIAQRAFYWWRRLPANIQAGYDPEDMIGEVVVHVLRVAKQYQPGKALPSTFVYHVADNKCQVIVSHYRAQKHTASLVPVEEQLHLSATDSSTRLREARSAVERVIESASLPLRTWLQAWLLQETRRRPAPSVAQELLTLSRRHGAHFRDFQVVFRQLVIQ